MMNKNMISFSELTKVNISEHIQIKSEENILQFQNILFDKEVEDSHDNNLKLTSIIRDSFNRNDEEIVFLNTNLEVNMLDEPQLLDVVFVNCKFNSLKLQLDTCQTGFKFNDIVYYLDKNKIRFKSCIFSYMPFYHTCEINVLLEQCTVSIFESINDEKKLECIDCTIGNFSIKDDNHNFNIELSGGIIENLTIENASFKSKFYINKQYGGNEKQTTIKKLSIKNTVFDENFKLHNCLVEKSIIKDADFKKHADFFMSTFKEGLNFNKNDKSINFKALNFKGLALFGDCEFHELLKFQYVTFENFSHFRRAKFIKGLDLDYTNIQKEMNFFDIEGLDNNVSKSNTSQETYRIIKHNFAKIGNTIEANKYHALELGRHNKNVWEKGRITDGIVSLLFWITSNFSQSWLLPLFWIFIIGTITAFSMGEVSLTSIIKYATITKMDSMDKKPILFVFNKASLGFLYYQFILSIRKNTRK